MPIDPSGLAHGDEEVGAWRIGEDKEMALQDTLMALWARAVTALHVRSLLYLTDSSCERKPHSCESKAQPYSPCVSQPWVNLVLILTGLVRVDCCGLRLDSLDPTIE